MYLVIIMTAIALSCQQAKEDQPKDIALQEVQLEQTDQKEKEEGKNDKKDESGNSNQKQQPPKSEPSASQTDWTQKIIKTANVSIELKDYH